MQHNTIQKRCNAQYTEHYITIQNNAKQSSMIKYSMIAILILYTFSQLKFCLLLALSRWYNAFSCHFQTKASASYEDMNDWLGKRFQQEMER